MPDRRLCEALEVPLLGWQVRSSHSRAILAKPSRVSPLSGINLEPLIQVRQGLREVARLRKRQTWSCCRFGSYAIAGEIRPKLCFMGAALGQHLFIKRKGLSPHFKSPRSLPQNTEPATS